MTNMDYSNPYKHPGSGGARPYPPSGGAPWWPLPEDTWQEVTTCTQVEYLATDSSATW